MAVNETKIQSFLTIPSNQQIRVFRPSGGPGFIVSSALLAGTFYNHTDAMLDAIELELEALTGEGWTIYVDADTGRVKWTVDAGGTFDLTWGGYAWIRDWLGWTGDVIGITGTSTAPNEHLGGLYLLRRIFQGSIPFHAQAKVLTGGGVTIGGRGDYQSASVSAALYEDLVLQLTRNSTDWWEFRQFLLLLNQIGDGRPFSLWDDPDDSAPLKAFRMIGPEEIMFEREHAHNFDLFRVTLTCTDGWI